jgi:hypothetical protein
MHRPLTETLSRARSRSQSLELDPDLVARSLGFGAVVPVNEPLPETPSPLQHVEDDFDLPIDEQAKRPAPKPSLQELVNARLLSIKPRTPERQQEVMELIGSLLEPLKAADELVAVLEEEHFKAFDDRWEMIRRQGRELVDSLPALEKELAEAQNYHRESQEKKSHRRTDLETYSEERKRISPWSTRLEIEAADKKLERAKAAMVAADEQEFERRKVLAVHEGKVATVRENLRLLKLELKRCEAELNGQPFFDPNYGLSTDPIAHRNEW